jgi:hypothetical protein
VPLSIADAKQQLPASMAPAGELGDRNERGSVAMKCTRLIAAAIVAFPDTAVGQRGPVTDALRVAARNASAILTVAVETMPREKYGIRPSPSDPTFGELAARAANVSILLCSRMAGRPPAPGYADESESKDTLTAKVRRRLAECEDALQGLTDARLGDTVRHNGMKTRAAVIAEALAFWGELPQQMAGATPRTRFAATAPDRTSPASATSFRSRPAVRPCCSWPISSRHPPTGARSSSISTTPW